MRDTGKPCPSGAFSIRIKERALDLLRRNYSSQITIGELVAVQPMNLPAGQIFYLDFVVDNNGARFLR